MSRQGVLADSLLTLQHFHHHFLLLDHGFIVKDLLLLNGFGVSTGLACQFF